MILQRDKQGYLAHSSDWNEEVALFIAGEEGLDLTPEHWEILFLLRQFNETYRHLPTMRGFVNYVKQELGEDKAKSPYLYKLFPDGPVKQGCKISGLPKPPHCI